MPEEKHEAGAVEIVVLDGATVAADGIGWDEFARLGTLTVYDRTPPELIVRRSGAAAVLVTNKTPLDAATLAVLPELRFIAVLATGHNVVDSVAARARGIPVANVPEYGTESVAQHTIALLLAMATGLIEHDRSVAAGEWCRSQDFCFWHSPPTELHGATLGLVGVGRIGRRVAEIASALGMRVLGTASRRRTGGGPAGLLWATLDEVVAASDALSLHCPLTPETEHLVDDALLARMKPGALLVNTARGPLLDEPAVARALESGHLGGLAVDVLSTEPPARDHPLLTAPRTIITPHLAWSSIPARRRLLAITTKNIESFLSSKPTNIVNP